MDKFRATAADDARALRAASVAIGDRARRAHRHGSLDARLATELRDDAVAARASLVSWLAAVRASPPYARAVRALAAGDVVALREAWPGVFAGVAADAPPPALFHPVVWQR